MNLKKLFALMLSFLLMLSFAACNGNGGDTDTDSSVSTGDTMVLGPLSGESDETLISRFTAEYEKALTAAAYVTEYNLNTRLDGENQLNVLGLFMVNGDDFSVSFETFPAESEQISASCVYLDGTLYTDLNGVTAQTAADAAQAKAQLASLGMTYNEIATSEFASKTLSRNMDGSFTVNVTLSDTALQQISAAALAEVTGISDQVVFQGVTLEITFSMEGALAHSRLISHVDVTVDGNVQDYRSEIYLKYTTFDASKIVITAPVAEE